MTYIDHVIRDTYVETRSELLDIGKLLYLLLRPSIFFLLFKESYEVFTMGENTNGNLGHSQVNKSNISCENCILPFFKFLSQQLKKCLN
jgi:hypothetical protein